MILSIVIPTLNRSQYLDGLLSQFTQELLWLPEELRHKVEIIVGDNCSDDETPLVLAKWTKFDWLRYKRFSDRVEVDKSIVRSIVLAQKQFIWVFGDDDSFGPGLLRAVLEELSARPAYCFLYFNRIVLDHRHENVIRIAHRRWAGNREEVPLADFIRRFTHWPGFITSIVFQRAAFDAGSAFALERYRGWTQLARVLFGAGSGTVLVWYHPMVTQRLGVHLWKKQWPRYWLVNMPQMLYDLERAGITAGAVEAWREEEVSVFRVFADAIVAKYYGISVKDSFWSEAARWQTGSKKLVLLLVRYSIHCRVASAVYRLFQVKYRND